MIHREKGQDPGVEPVPDGLPPMKAATGPLPTGRAAHGWAAEFKWDGVRALCLIDGGRLRIRSRRGNDVTGTYPELKELAKTVSDARLLLDGEIIALDAAGRVSFAALQPRFGTSGAEAERLARTNPVSLMVFDLLYLDGHDTTGLPYAERRRLLEGLELAGPRWQTPPSFTDTPASDVLTAARAAGLEGVVLKRLDSPYRPGARSADWRKVKLVASQSAVVGGFTPAEAGRRAARGPAPGDRRAAARRPRRRRPPPLRGQGRLGLHRAGPPRAADRAVAPAGRGVAVLDRGRARRRADRDVGRAGRRRRGDLHRLDGQGPAPASRVPGHPPRRAARGGRP